jgi:hypothetical protein
MAAVVQLCASSINILLMINLKEIILYMALMRSFYILMWCFMSGKYFLRAVILLVIPNPAMPLLMIQIDHQQKM